MKQPVQKRHLPLWIATFFLLAVSVTFTASTVQAAKTGFVKKGSKTYYVKADGSYAKGWMKLNKKKYYFDKSTGVMLTGWSKSRRYFHPKEGYMVTKWLKLKGKIYYLQPSNGKAVTGWVTDNKGNRRYFNSNGSMRTGWSSHLRYFDTSTGVMATGWKEINEKKYYFDPDTGSAKTGWLTLKKKKYYFDEQGVMQTDWQKIDEKWYYFDLESGKMAANTTQDQIELGKDGAAVTDKSQEKLLNAWVDSAKILILSGHGQGDVGATARVGGTYYEEYLLTREFAKLIYQNLYAARMKVTLYDQNYDFYQVNAGLKDGPVPNLNYYDYVLEIHFNASDTGYEDLGGNGQYKGCGMMVNSAKKNVKLDKQIIQAIYKLGFKIWGTDGIHTSSGLLNAKTCQARGVSYGLLETAFIDDRDDMAFYQKNKAKMAKAVSKTIVNYFKK